MATIVILIGTVVTMFYPMLTPGMHPKLENLNPYTPLQLAGKDIYQREGCNNCHTQTVRPLKTEVMRYGEYSKAGEFTYDRPFLWGSKRTGPDLARVGGKYPDAWHYMHFENPQAFYDKSNMPKYAWLKKRKLDPASMKAHMETMASFYPAGEISWTDGDLKALADKTDMDALVAYMQAIGISVAKREAQAEAAVSEEKNPRAEDAKAIHEGEELYERNCEACHGDHGKGGIGPSLTDTVWLNKQGDISDGQLHGIIANGTQAGMPPYDSLGKDRIWALVAYIRSLQKK